MTEIAANFEKTGGKFLSSPSEIKNKLKFIKAFVFDWDGVFNTGYKGNEHHSGFFEPDAMGVNMLRFGYWLIHNHNFPVTAIITGSDNPNAKTFAERENIHAVFSGSKNKTVAINRLCHQYLIDPSQIAFFFDDILDLNAAKICGLRFHVRRNIPAFCDFVLREKLCDYITANTSGNYALRECCELILCLQDNYDNTIHARMEFGTNYQEYLSMKKNIITELFDAF